MKKKRILVCGASGFIGRNIFDRLVEREDCEVFGTYYKKKPHHKNMMQADLTDKSDVTDVMIDWDVIIQCAAVTSGARDIVTRPQIHITDNTIMNTLILEAAYNHSVPQFIFPSCTTMYPMDLETLKKGHVKEDAVDINNIHKNYFGGAWMKLYAERLCEFYSRLGKTRFTIMRHSNIYGPHDKFDLERSHLIGATIAKVMRANDGDAITVWGDGTEIRDILYIDGLVDFVERVLDTKSDQEPFGIYNVGYGISYSVRQIVECIIMASKKNLSITFDASKPTIPTYLMLDIQKARESFGWTPHLDFREGLRKTIEWYTNNIQK